MQKIDSNLNEENKKIIWNAISSYLLLFVSIFFLFNKSDKNLNNSFVKSHTKVAFIIHLCFLSTLIIFNFLWLFNDIIILWYNLNNLISSSLFILLFFALLFWIYKAYSWKSFDFKEITKSNNINSNLIDINNDGKLDEKDKLTILLSYIPIIGYIISWKYKKQKIIKDISKLNLLISLIITLIYISWYYNVANLFSLLYIIFIVFVWINIFVNNRIISINLPFILSPEDKFNLILNLKNYLKNYFNEEKFLSIKRSIKRPFYTDSYLI